MEVVLQFLQDAFPWVFAHKYWFFFLGSMIEGLNTLVLGGFLVSTNSINFLPVFLIFTAGYSLNGYIWYGVGYFAGSKPIDRWIRSKPKGEKIMSQVQDYFERYSGRAIVITKFTFSLTVATLIMAGSLKYNLKRFAVYNFLGSVGWVAVTMSIGYFFGQSYKFFFVYIKNFTYFVIFLAGAIAIIYLIKNLAASAFIKSLTINGRLRNMGDKLRDNLDKLLTKDEDNEL